MSDDSQSADLSPKQKRVLLEQLLRERASPPDAPFPLSQGQRSMWFFHRLDPGSAAYNTGSALRILSTLDVPALRRSLQILLDRHPALRMVILDLSGEPVQRPQADRPAHFECVDASAWTSDELSRRVHEAYARPFDLETGPLARAYLFSRSDADHVLLLTIHHIACDGWSFWILLDELFAVYAAETKGIPAALPPLTRQYKDFVDWQARMLAGPDAEKMESFWRMKLAGRLPLLNLPTDHPRPLRQSFNGASRDFRIPEEATRALKRAASKEGATLFMLLLAAYGALLHRYTGQDDILIGSPTTGRSRAEFAGTVGDFINMIALREDLSGDPPFEAFLEKIRRTVLESLENQDFPFPLLVERLGVPRDPSRMPVYQSIFVLQRPHRFGERLETFDPVQSASRLDIGGLTVESYPLGQQEGQFDLALEMMDVRGSLLGKLKYNTDLFESGTIERMAGHFRTLLEGVAADPRRRLSELPLLTAGEREQMLVEWNRTEKDYRRDQGPARLFEAQAERTPEAVAVVYGDRLLTYEELNRRANRLAHYLKRQGIGPNVLVGICLERSPEMMVGLLGILKAGGAYVPLDPDLPRERLGFMLEDSGVALLVSQESLREGLPEHRARVISLDQEKRAIEAESGENPDSLTKPEDPAYVIYTSGSTGKPKGVEIPLGAVANFLQSMKREPGMGAEDVLLAVTTLSFDIAGLELYLPLAVGGRVVIAGREVVSDGIRLAGLLVESRATLMQATPAGWKLLRAGGWKGGGRLKMLCGGEALSPELAKELAGTGGELWNMYGPTETTIWSTISRLKGNEERISIGRPIDNTRVYILDGKGQPVPIGVPGELHIGGEGLARGYLNRSELTAEKFVPDPFAGRAGSLMYKTGDLACWRADGTLECLGRLDQQVKVRGYRIELGEIEAVMREQAGVRDAVVAAREDRPDEKRLVGYVITDEGTALNVDGLRRALKAKLPDYMIPEAFVRLEVFPLTPNGKVDRRSLPPPEPIRPELESNYEEPQSAMEGVVASIWKDVLHLAHVGRHDNFFDRGGHSLLVTQFVSRLRAAAGVELPLSVVFEEPTVAALAKHTESLLWAAHCRQPAAGESEGDREIIEI